MGKAQETMDAELIALSAVVFMEAVQMKCADEDRLRKGQAPCYGENVQSSDAECMLGRLLKERGLLP